MLTTSTRSGAACPSNRNDGWGWTEWDSCRSKSWGYCVGNAGPQDKGYEWQVLQLPLLLAHTLTLFAFRPPTPPQLGEAVILAKTSTLRQR